MPNQHMLTGTVQCDKKSVIPVVLKGQFGCFAEGLYEVIISLLPAVS